MSKAPRRGVLKRLPQLPPESGLINSRVSKADLMEAAWHLASLANDAGSVDDHASTRDRLVAELNTLRAARGQGSLNLTPRGHKSSVHGSNYLVHLPRPAPYQAFVWCGRPLAKVNSYPAGYVSLRAPEEEEQTCLACIKTRALAGKISPEEA